MPHKTRHIFLKTALMFLALSSCSRQEIAHLLDNAESYISESPDSALTVLDSLSSVKIRGREAKARFALMYSMALDKNYIDQTDDSLINIAVHWYSRYGSADEQMKSYYYQGRVYQNAGDNESAMESFVNAEAAAGQADDYVAKGMLYNAMSAVYIHIFDIETAEKYNNYAKKCYLEAGDRRRYASALCSSSNFLYIAGDYQRAEACLDSVKALWNDLDPETRNSYYLSVMDIDRIYGNKKNLSLKLEEYIKEFPNDGINWLGITGFYTFLQEYESAFASLDNYKRMNADYMNDPAYHVSMSDLYDSLGLYDKALDAYRHYSDISDSISLVIARQDTGFMKEKYENEMQILRQKNTKTFIALVSVVAIAVLSYFSYIVSHSLKKRNEENRAMTEANRKMEEEIARNRKNYAELKQERDELARILDNNPGIDIDRQSLKVMNDRLALLNRLFVAEIADDNDIARKANKEFERLVENREEFLYTTRMTFAAAHPKFIRYLESKGLTEWETEYCCLYAIGLRGKDIGSYINRKRHYNDSSEIREKLGLGEHDTNLGNHLRELLTE